MYAVAVQDSVRWVFDVHVFQMPQQFVDESRLSCDTHAGTRQEGKRNRLFLSDVDRERHHCHIDREPLATKPEKRTVDYLT
jgi:creatinine amidohydrolase/Fe(II)-dependent formamide hydrolase-like protein